jgi:outer membrane lipoprotein-sorting protein
MLKTVSAIAAALIVTAAATAQTIPVPRAATGRDSAPKPPSVQRSTPLTSNAGGPQQPLDQGAMVERVSAYLSNMKTLVGDFVQVGPDGRRTEGQFYVQKPGKVRFEYSPPSRVDVIADGQSVVVRDRKRATQDLYPLSQTPLRFLVADRVDLARDTNLVAVGADEQFVTVVIEEQQLVGTNRLMLKFGAQDFKLRQWTVTDPQGYDTTVAVYNLDASKKLDPALFQINYENPDTQNAR